MTTTRLELVAEFSEPIPPTAEAYDAFCELTRAGFVELLQARAKRRVIELRTAKGALELEPNTIDAVCVEPVLGEETPLGDDNRLPAWTTDSLYLSDPRTLLLQLSVHVVPTALDTWTAQARVFRKADR